MWKGISSAKGPPSGTALLRNGRFELIRCGKSSESGLEEAVRSGLTDSPKHLPYRFLYDEEGSKLFEAICGLPEYYLTRAEAEIVCVRAAEIALRFGPAVELIDLGSGNGSKTRILIEELFRQGKQVRYMPVDISPTALENASRQLLNDYPDLEIVAVAGEYRQALAVLSSAGTEPKLVLWLGSNIGNLDRGEAMGFLRLVRGILKPEDSLLVGIDLDKDPAVLERAYNDSAGVTAEFSRNILARINRELAGEFDLNRFQHHASYNDREGRIEIGLVSDGAQRVRIAKLELEIAFRAGETVHTEYSYKYSPAQISDVVSAAGLLLERQWLDSRGLFSLNRLIPRRQERT